MKISNLFRFELSILVWNSAMLPLSLESDVMTPVQAQESTSVLDH